MHRKTSRIARRAALAGLACTVGAVAAATPATAATPYCPAGSKASFARVQLYAGANCKGGSVIVNAKAKEPNGDRPSFAAFRNWDGNTYNVDNTRSSLALAANTCVRLFDGASYTGAQSNLLCAPAGAGAYFGLFSFNDRVSSMRVCAGDRRQQCERSGGATPAPAPAPEPAPTPPPAPAGFPADFTSAPDVARYDDAGPWAGGRNCTGGFTAGAKRMQAWLRANYGAATIQGYNCRRNTADRSRTSIHGVGRANDWFRNASDAADRAQVNSFILRMSANGAAMARAMGIQYWVWNHNQYSVRGNAVRVRAYGGPNPHTEHVHLEMNLAGSRLATSYWRAAGR